MVISSTTKENFIKQIGPIMVRVAKSRGYKNVSGSIAQACIESMWGVSSLAAKYHNYFGIKCGSSYSGPSVSMKTNEEYKVGILTTIKDNFRVYTDMEAGAAGYYDFLKYPRYKALKDQTSPETFLQAIKAAGYATSSKYVNTNMSVVNAYNLRSFDTALNAAEIAKTNTVPEYRIGHVYITRAELRARRGPGKEYQALSHSQLSKNAQLHDTDHDGAIDKETRISCLSIQKDDSGNTWIRTPSGWIAAYYDGHVYVS